MDSETALTILAALGQVAKDINLSDAWTSIESAFRDKHLVEPPPPRGDAAIKAEQQASIRRRFGDSA